MTIAIGVAAGILLGAVIWFVESGEPGRRLTESDRRAIVERDG